MSSHDVKIIFGEKRHELCIPVNTVEEMRSLGEALLEAGAALIYGSESPNTLPDSTQQTFDWAAEADKISA